MNLIRFELETVANFSFRVTGDRLDQRRFSRPCFSQQPKCWQMRIVILKRRLQSLVFHVPRSQGAGEFFQKTHDRMTTEIKSNPMTEPQHEPIITQQDQIQSKAKPGSSHTRFLACFRQSNTNRKPTQLAIQDT